MFPEERITQVRDCGCEKGCRHKVVIVTQEFIIPIEALNDFIKDFNNP